MLGRLCLLLFLCGWFSQGAKGQCTAGSPCSLELGTPFPDIEPSSYEDVDVFFEITKNDPQYFAFDLTEEDCKETIHLSLTLLYGLADIHLTDDGSTPSLSNFKWSSHRSDIREIISMTPDELGGCAGGRAVSAAVAAGEPARGRLLLSKASAPAALKVGLPQLAVAPEATGRGARLYSLATAELAPGAPLLVSVTQLGGALAGLTLTNGEHSWSAHPDADGESYLYFTSPSTSLGEPTSTIEVACANASAFVVLAAHGTAQHPTWLPGGLALVDYAPAGQTRHYVAELPAARGGDAAFAVALEPQHGAAPDLFLASRAAGFVEPEEADEVGDGEETWLAATGGNGFELVTAKSGDGVYVDGGGRYYVTAAAAAMDDEEEGEFDAGALYAAALTSAASLTALRESRPIYSTAAKGEYKYFQFYDANPTEENNLMILLSSISGDADLFVGCVVNNTGNDNGFPSKQSGHYNFSSQSFWDDSVTIHHADAKSCAKPGHPGTFYAAVRGYSAAEFTVTAVRGGGTITLRPGVPQLGTVFATMWQRYRVWVGEQRRAFSVVVTPEYGDPDILVSADGKEATWLHFQAASLHSGQDPDSVTLTASQVCAECWVSMEVISVWGEARYAITATLGDGGVVLKDAWPQQATLGPAEYAFFSFTPAEDGDLVATLTVLHGHADLVLSTDIERPTFEEEDADGVYTATQDGHETPRITVQNVRAGQKWHLGVLGAGEGQTASVVTVQAHLERGGGAATLNHLLDGVPQDDLLAAGETHYFQLAAQPGHGVVKFIATPFEGRVDMWVRRCAAADGGGRCAAPGRLPSAGNHTWSAAAAPSGEAVTFDRLDAAPTSYLVALENPGQVAADVALTGYFEGSVLRLVPGKAVRDHVKEGQTAYYKVEARAFNSTLTVALTAFSGDPDLYASTSIAHPNAENFTWVMNTAGDDTLHIHPDQVECMAAVCTVFVGVYGWEEADYSIVAKFAGTDEVALRLGQPQTDAVAEGDYAYYRYRLAADYRLQPDLTLSLTMAYGDADLFATLDGTEPSYANCHYCSESTVGAEALTVRPSEALYQEHCGDGGDGVAGDGRGCMLRVSVYGYSAAEYTLLLRAAGREPALLQENVPFQATLAQGAYEYFEFVWQEPKMDLHVTSFSGHPTLYMSFENRWPNATVADYHLGPLHMGDAATVFIIAEPNDTLPMPVYFSVYGATATHFALMASQSGERGGDVARLYYGLQQAGGVAQGDFKYYRVRTAARQATVELLVSATEGNVDLYVGRLDQDLPELDEDGKVVNYVLKAVTPGAGEHIEVPFGGLGLCFRPDMGSCYFVLAVYGAQDSLYTVLATTAEQLDLLQDGVPQRGHAAQGRYAYYGFQLLDPEADLAVTVTPFSGDPDLYVGPGPPAPLPTKTNRTWASAWIGEEALTLQAAEMAELCTPSPDEGRACEYIFAVHGFTNTTFTITVATATGWENPTVLLLGQPQTGVVADQGFTYYQIHLVQDGDREPNVVVTLTSLDGGDQDLYITFDPAQEPGPDTAVVASNSWSGSEVVRLTPGMPDYCATCTMYIGVYGYIGGSFTLVVSTGLQQLQAGHPQHGSVAQGDYQYYALYNPGGGALALDLTALSGDADLFVATDLALPEGELPDYSLFGWASYAQGSDSVRILPTDEGYCTDCTFLVGVYGFTNASYTLAARLGEGAGGEVTRLTHHRPQSGAAAAGETQYFSVALGNAREDLVLALTALTGRADLYVKRAIADADGSVSLGGLPSADDYEYTTLGLAVERIVIPSGSGSGQEDFGTIASYVIALVAEQDTEYSLVATYGYHPQVLQANVPVRAAVAAGGTAYYEFLLDRNEDVHISCVAISGDPDIVVSTGPGLPSCIIPEGTQGTACTNFTWGSFDYSTDTLTISHTNPCVPTTENAIIYDCDPSQFHQGPFYIGVYSQNGAAFTLAAGAAGGVTSLVDGLPQHGVTAPDVLCEHLNTEGGCDDDEDDRQWAQVARFRFKEAESPLRQQPDLRQHHSHYMMI